MLFNCLPSQYVSLFFFSFFFLAMGRFYPYQILLALVALAAAAYLHLFCDIPTYTILLAWEVSTFAVCGYLAAADFFSTPRSEFVVEQLYRYGLRFSVLAMLGCLTEDTFGFGMRVICGGSLPHLFPLYDILVIMYLMRSVKQNDLKLEKKMVAAEKLGGRTSSLTT